MRKFLGCVFLTICCHYAQSSRRLLGTEYSNEPRYSAQRPQWRTKENFLNFYKPELRTSRNIEPGHNPSRNNINTKSLNMKLIFHLIFFQFHFKRLYLPCAVSPPGGQTGGSGTRRRAESRITWPSSRRGNSRKKPL